MDALLAPERVDATEGGDEKCNTRSTFETFKYNSCNIRLKVVETLEICFFVFFIFIFIYF